MLTNMPDRRVGSRARLPGYYLWNGIRAAGNAAGLYYTGKRNADTLNSAYKGYKKAKGAFGKSMGKVTISSMGGNGKNIRRRKKKGGRRKKTFTKKLIKRVKKLEHKSANTAQHIHKSTAVALCSAATNSFGFAELELVGVTTIEAVLDSLPQLNVAAPGTFTTTNMTSVTVPTKWRVECYAKALMRNNYLYPIIMDCYILQPKTNLANTPGSAVTNGLTLMGGGGGAQIVANTDHVFYPSLSKEFRDGWKIIKHHHQKLNSGDEMEMPYSTKVWYDQEWQDRYTTTYTKKYSRIVLVRIQGCLGHETGVPSANIGFTKAYLDICVERTFKVTYPSPSATRTLEETKGVVDLTTAIVGVSSAEVENAP